MTNSKTLQPIKPEERILVLDVLRGFALFGILLVNMDFFVHPSQMILFPLPESVLGVDRVIAWFIKFAGEGKFYTIFSILFAYGFTIIMSRAEERNAKFLSIISRRYLFLFLFGLFHAFLIWVGDILALYGLLGFVLILFRNAKPKTILIWVIIILVLPILFTLLGAIAIELGKSIPEIRQEIEKSFLAQAEFYKKDIDRAYSVYPVGSFWEITQQRIHDMKFMGGSLIFIGPNVFAMFLIGLYLGKKRFFHELENNLNVLKKIFIWGLIIGLIGNFVYATLILDLERFKPTIELFVASFFQMIGVPALSLFYISAICMLVIKKINFIKYIAAAGRMALSNYFMQSIICTLIVYGYGLGMFSKISKTEGLIITVLIYLVQIVIANVWFKKFQFGPLEWVWRKFTYLR